MAFCPAPPEEGMVGGVLETVASGVIRIEHQLRAISQLEFACDDDGVIGLIRDRVTRINQEFRFR